MQLQRVRILQAIVEVVAERGYASASVAMVCAYAKVSRSTFYELFSGLEDCFLEILDQGMEVMSGVMAQAFLAQEDWLDGLLYAEAAVLCYLDSEPQFARVLLVETLGAGAWALERRERNVAALRSVIVEQFKDTPVGGDFPPLAAAGVMASLLGIMQDHLLRGEDTPLISLLGPLMGVITTPYLDSDRVAHEIHRGEQLARILETEQTSRPTTPAGAQGGTANGAPERDDRKVGGVGVGVGVGQLVALPPLLGNAKAGRARLCVSFLAVHPGASNTQVAAGVGIANKGQISTLLARLYDAGIISKHSYGPGRANAWCLTEYGEQVAVRFELDEAN